MLTSKLMRIISVVGIILLLSLQYVWLKNSYQVAEIDLLEKSKKCLTEAVEEDLFERCDKAKVKVSVAREENIDKRSIKEEDKEVSQFAEIYIGLQDVVESIGFPYSVRRIDTLFQKKIVPCIGFLPKYSIRIIDDSIRYKATSRKVSTGFAKDEIFGDAIFLKLGSKQSIEMVLTAPTASVVNSAKYIFLVSIILVLLIGVILLFQLKSMIRDKNFSDYMKNYTRILAHETRTPINDIYLLTTILMSDDFVDKEKRDIYYNECLNQCSKMLIGIDNILLVAKSEKTNIQIFKSHIDLHTFIEKIANKYRNNYFLRKNLNIETHCDSEECMAYIDPELIENVLLNLIENAIKYSKESLVISISCTIENKHIILQVKDNGVGISSEDLKHVFQIFKRGKKCPRNNIKGFGIGLYYVYKVVKAHKGNVKVNSIEGVGSEFTIDIPNRFQ